MWTECDRYLSLQSLSAVAEISWFWSGSVSAAYIQIVIISLWNILCHCRFYLNLPFFGVGDVWGGEWYNVDRGRFVSCSGGRRSKYCLSPDIFVSGNISNYHSSQNTYTPTHTPHTQRNHSSLSCKTIALKKKHPYNFKHTHTRIAGACTHKATKKKLRTQNQPNVYTYTSLVCHLECLKKTTHKLINMSAFGFMKQFLF